MALRYLPTTDPELAAAIDAELARQRGTIELIASENFVSMSVLEAAGTVLTNKYAEGLPGKRYYAAASASDVVETSRVSGEGAFGAEHANVQPHAGAPANLAVYYAFLEPGDTFLGMNLAMGGHLTHGSRSISRQVVQRRALRARRRRAYRYGRGPAARQAAPAEDDHRGASPIRGPSTSSGSLRSHATSARFSCRHGAIAGLVATGAHPSPGSARRRGDIHLSQDAPRPRSGFILTTAEHATAIDKAVFPGLQGGPLEHIIAGEGCRVPRGRAA